MHLEHFGLSVNPFGISPRLDFLYKSGAFEESIAHLVYGLDNSEAIVMISGAIGTGKTMAVQSFLSHLGDRYVSALITNTCIDGRGLLKLILDDLGAPMEPGADKSDLLIAFKKFMIESGRDGKRIVIVIDEAQNLTREVLEEIRQLTNLGQGDEQPVQIVLVGQPELEATVQRPDLAQLKQRIRVHYNLSPLSRREAEEYIDHRMEVAGGKRGVFSAKALDRIYEQSGGVPRVVNTLCAEALLSAFVAGRHKVEASDLEEEAESAASREPARAVDRVESPVAAPGAPVREPRINMAVRREVAPRSTFAATESPTGDEPRRGRGRGAWVVAVVVLGAIAVFAVTGRLDGLWSRLPFAAGGAGRHVDATTELAAVPGADIRLAAPVVTAVDTAQLSPAADVGPVAPAADSLRMSTAAASMDTMSARPLAQPKPGPRIAAATPMPAGNAVAGTAVREEEGATTGNAPAEGSYYIHVSSFLTADHAASIAQKFSESGLNASVREQLVGDKMWQRVYLGPFGSRDGAVHVANRLRDEGSITYYKIVRIAGGEGE